MRARSIHPVLALIIGLTMLGCSVQRFNFNEAIEQEKLSFIHPGGTTLHQVVHQLGAPEEITIVANQLIVEYKWSTTRSSSLNLGHLFRIVSPVAPPLTMSGTGINIQRLVVICDGQLIVRSYALGLTEEHAVVEFWPF